MRPGDLSVPVIAFVGGSGSGKTSLLVEVIERLRRRGIRVGAIKHSHHDFTMDVPGKDSHRLPAAGADQVLLASPYRTAWIREGDGRSEPRLEELVGLLDSRSLDLVLVEGFRGEDVPKIEVFRHPLGRPPLFPDDPAIVAVVCDAPPDQPCDRLMLSLNDPAAVTDLVQGIASGAVASRTETSAAVPRTVSRPCNLRS